MSVKVIIGNLPENEATISPIPDGVVRGPKLTGNKSNSYEFTQEQLISAVTRLGMAGVFAEAGLDLTKTSSAVVTQDLITQLGKKFSGFLASVSNKERSTNTALAQVSDFGSWLMTYLGYTLKTLLKPTIQITYE